MSIDHFAIEYKEIMISLKGISPKLSTYVKLDARRIELEKLMGGKNGDFYKELGRKQNRPIKIKGKVGHPGLAPAGPGGRGTCNRPDCLNKRRTIGLNASGVRKYAGSCNPCHRKARKEKKKKCTI